MTGRVSVAEISADLGARAESFCRAYFSEGCRQGDYWQVGDTSGAAGRSLVIRLQAQDGRKAGGWIDYATGEFGDLIDLLHAKLGSTSLKEPFESEFDLPIKFVNDANAFALGHQHLVEGTDYIVLTLGTGLGSGIITQGKLLLGPNSMAGEAGHIPIDQGRTCACGGIGHWEAYIGSYGLIETANKYNLKINKPKELFDLADSGDPNALNSFKEYGQDLGRGCAVLVSLFCPDIIFVAGGIAQAEKFFLNDALEEMNKNTFSTFKNTSELKLSPLSASTAGILGPAVLFQDVF